MLMEILIIIAMPIAAMLAIYAAFYALSLIMNRFDWPKKSLSEEEMIERYFSRTRLGDGGDTA